MQGDRLNMSSRFFFRNAPGDGFLFGSGLLLWWMFFLLLMLYPLPAALDGDVLATAVAAAGGILFAGCWVYGSILLGRSLFTLAEEWPRIRRFRYGICLFALLFPLAGFAAAPFLFRKRRWGFAICALVSACTEVIPMVYSFSPRLDCILFFGGLILLFLSGFGLREGCGWRGTVFFPIGCWLLFLLAIPVWENILEGKIAEEKNAISRLIGQSVNLPEFQKREQTGFSIHAEPLKSLIASVPDCEEEVKKFHSDKTEKMRLLAKLEKAPMFLAARNELLKLPPQNIVHDWPGKEALFDMPLPEMKAFQVSAGYSGLKMQLNASQKPLVLRYHGELERLRDWMLCTHTLLAGVLADWIEKLRLKSFSPVLAAGTFSREEVFQLAGKTPDWGRKFALAMGCEVTIWNEFFRSRNTVSDYLEMQDVFLKHSDNNVLPPLPSMLFFLRIHFLRDHLYLLRQFRKHAELFLFPEKMPLAERFQAARIDRNTIRKNYFNWTKLVLAESIAHLHLRWTETEAYHRMVRIAAEIQEYCRTHEGKLPVSLEFLPPSLPSSIDGIPIGYQTGFLSCENGKNRYGFRLSFSTKLSDRKPLTFEVIRFEKADGKSDPPPLSPK